MQSAEATPPTPGASTEPEYRTLPEPVRLHETIASVDADPVPDPAAGRNLDQHRALRDD
ncbi:MAG TPA: hypothetical protein VFM50_09040 [Nocardioidaceae bacterium]|jgi:hypothetical protein|nr:hypothetical protein [Nocardioidaceae bacterium]